MRRLSTRNEVNEWLKEYNFTKVAFDTETNGDSEGPAKYTNLVIEGMSFYNGTEAVYIDLFENIETTNIMKDMSLVFSDKIKILIAHNIVFDMKVLHRYGISCEHIRIYDTMVADHLLDETREHGLKKLAKDLLGRTAVVAYEQAVASGKHSTYFAQYACDDVVNAWDLCVLQQPQLKEQGLASLFREIEMPFQFALLDMAVSGLRIDMEKLKELREKVSVASEKFEEEMYQILKEPYSMQFDLMGNAKLVGKWNFNSYQHLGEIMYDILKLPCTSYTESGKRAVGIEAINELRNAHPFVTVLAKYKIAQKLLGAFLDSIPKFIESDGKIRPNFHDCGTETGRLSSSRINMQQQPTTKEQFPVDVRGVFSADGGCSMISCDFSAQELRLISHVTNEPVMKASFFEGTDLHLTTAKSMFNLDIPTEALNEKHPDYEKYKKKYKEQRNKAKIINFSVAYGKAQPLDSKILTPDGWKRMGDIVLGDIVFSRRGKQTKVVGVFPQGKLPVYEVTFDDGRSTRCTENHLWVTCSNNEERLMFTQDIIEFMRTNKKRRVTVPYNEPIEYPGADLPVHPKILGMYIGDGNSCMQFTLGKESEANEIRELLPEGHSLRYRGKYHYAIISGVQKSSEGTYLRTNRVKEALENLGYKGKTALTKFIPEQYLRASIPQRRALLEGLLLTDGSKNNNGFEYSTSSPRLAEDVVSLVRSLGGRASYTSRIPQTNFKTAHRSYRIFISFPPYRRASSIVSIKYVNTDECQCIRVEDETQTYITDNYIVTHNSPKGFATDFRVSEQEAQAILDRYFATYPNFKRAIDQCTAFVKANGYAQTIFGRRRRFKPITDDRGNTYYPKSCFRQAFNHLIQGAGGDMMRLAAIGCHSLKKQFPMWDLHIIASVHDELLFTCRTAHAQEAAVHIKQVFETCTKLSVPVVSSVSVGNNYGELK